MKGSIMTDTSMDLTWEPRTDSGITVRHIEWKGKRWATYDGRRGGTPVRYYRFTYKIEVPSRHNSMDMPKLHRTAQRLMFVSDRETSQKTKASAENNFYAAHDIGGHIYDVKVWRIPDARVDHWLAKCNGLKAGRSLTWAGEIIG